MYSFPDTAEYLIVGLSIQNFKKVGFDPAVAESNGSDVDVPVDCFHFIGASSKRDEHCANMSDCNCALIIDGMLGS